VLLQTGGGLHRGGDVAVPGFAAVKDDHEALRGFDAQKLPELAGLLRIVAAEQNREDEAVFNDRSGCLELFAQREVETPLFLRLVDGLHGPAERIDEFHAVERLVEIFHDAERQSLARVVEAVVGAHDDENRAKAVPAHLAHGLEPVDAGHLDVHERDVRAEALGLLDGRAAGLGGGQLAPAGEIFLDQKAHGVEHDALVIRQQNSIHPGPPHMEYEP